MSESPPPAQDRPWENDEAAQEAAQQKAAESKRSSRNWGIGYLGFVVIAIVFVVWAYAPMMKMQ